MTKKMVSKARRWLENIALFVAPLIVVVGMSFAVDKAFQDGIQTGELKQKQALHAAIVANITYCESRDIHNRTSNKGAFGRAQFMSYTFDWMKKLAKKPHLQWRNEADQMVLLNWAVANGYGSHWQYCYREAVKKAAEQSIQYASL